MEDKADSSDKTCHEAKMVDGGDSAYGGSMSLNLTAPCELSLIVKREGDSFPSER